MDGLFYFATKGRRKHFNRYLAQTDDIKIEIKYYISSASRSGSSSTFFSNINIEISLRGRRDRFDRIKDYQCPSGVWKQNQEFDKRKTFLYGAYFDNGIEIERCFSQNVIDALSDLEIPAKKVYLRGILHPHNGQMSASLEYVLDFDEFETQLNSLVVMYTALTDSWDKKRVVKKRQIEQKRVKHRQVERKKPVTILLLSDTINPDPKATNNKNESNRDSKSASATFISHQTCLLRFTNGVITKQGADCLSFQEISKYYDETTAIPQKPIKLIQPFEQEIYKRVFGTWYKEIPASKYLVLLDGVEGSPFLATPVYSVVTYEGKQYYLIKNTRHPAVSSKSPQIDDHKKWTIHLVLVDKNQQTDLLRKQSEKILRDLIQNSGKYKKAARE